MGHCRLDDGGPLITAQQFRAVDHGKQEQRQRDGHDGGVVKFELSKHDRGNDHNLSHQRGNHEYQVEQKFGRRFQTAFLNPAEHARPAG